jgi:N-succinyldiaminopimelate aminotransferase
MSRPLLNWRLEGLGTTIFAEMSARALVTGSVNLGQGFPDRDGPAKIAQVAADAILAGRGNQYPPGPGVPELRQAIAVHDERFYGPRSLNFSPGKPILILPEMGRLEAWHGSRFSPRCERIAGMGRSCS